MLNLYAQRVQCGDYYTVATTADGEIIFWGLYSKMPSRSSALLHGSDEDSLHKDMCSPSDLLLEQPVANGDAYDVAMPKPCGKWRRVATYSEIIIFTPQRCGIDAETQ